MLTKEIIQQKVDAELKLITDENTLGKLKPFLVTPRCELRGWDYGELGQTFPCWIVLNHLSSNTCIAYCEQGFGLRCPWGLLGITGEYLSIGSDYSWFSTFEEAFLDSCASE